MQSTTAKHNAFSWNPSDPGKGKDNVHILYSNGKGKHAEETTLEISKNLPGKASNTKLLSQSPSRFEYFILFCFPSRSMYY